MLMVEMGSALEGAGVNAVQHEYNNGRAWKLFVLCIQLSHEWSVGAPASGRTVVSRICCLGMPVPR